MNLNELKSYLGQYIDTQISTLSNDDVLHQEGLFLLERIIKEQYNKQNVYSYGDVTLPKSCREFIERYPTYTIRVNVSFLQDLPRYYRYVLNREYHNIQQWLDLRVTRSIYKYHSNDYKSVIAGLQWG